jgi:hypothetical protein
LRSQDIVREFAVECESLKFDETGFLLSVIGAGELKIFRVCGEEVCEGFQMPGCHAGVFAKGGDGAWFGIENGDIVYTLGEGPAD